MFVKDVAATPAMNYFQQLFKINYTRNEVYT